MTRSSIRSAGVRSLAVRSAGLAILLTMNGCGNLLSSGSSNKSPALNVAEAALQGGAGEVALRVSDGYLQQSPNDVRALEIKGDALSLLGDYDGATAIFQALLAKDPTSIRANTGLGRIKLTKDPAAADTLFLTVLKRDPKDLTALNDLGIARDLMGRHAEAQIAYRQALGINPDLQSAKVNLALSLAMTGQGSDAIQLLRADASQPGATLRIKHDYAVVLAMAGHRAEAEQVLRQDLPPDQVHQVLDSVTGTHTRVVRDGAADEPAGVSRIAALPRNDEVPPDVVQVPEVPSQPAMTNHVARATVASDQPLTIAALSAPVMSAPAMSAPAMSAPAMSAPAPMVVRPHPAVDPDADAPVIQPVNPAAAAMTYQRPLALPIHANDTLTQGTPAPVTEDATTVAMPPVRRPPPAPVRLASADPAPVAFPDAPPAPPVLAPAPLPPAYRPAARVEAPWPAPEPVQPPVQPLMQASLAPPLSGVAASATPEPAPRAAIRAPEEAASVAVVPAPRHEFSSLAVQFAATSSEDAAHSFWRELVQRFPEALGQREPTVIRFNRGGTVFWRVRTEGFGSASEAQSLCAQMRASGQDCFVPRS
jgi:Flp pilus assembly protein TadD